MKKTIADRNLLLTVQPFSIEHLARLLQDPLLLLLQTLHLVSSLVPLPEQEVEEGAVDTRLQMEWKVQPKWMTL